MSVFLHTALSTAMMSQWHKDVCLFHKFLVLPHFLSKKREFHRKMRFFSLLILNTTSVILYIFEVNMTIVLLIAALSFGSTCTDYGIEQFIIINNIIPPAFFSRLLNRIIIKLFFSRNRADDCSRVCARTHTHTQAHSEESLAPIQQTTLYLLWKDKKNYCTFF